MALVSYTDCAAMLAGLRAHLAAHIGPYGIGGGPYYGRGVATSSGGVAVPGGVNEAGVGAPVPAAAAPTAGTDQTGDHSTTNVQEAGVGEPDIVETDGRRVVSVSGGILRVVDVATRRVTGTLDLGLYAGADGAQLLMSGDRLLVILADQVAPYYGGPVPAEGVALRPYGGPAAGSTFLLVDMSSGQPRIVDTMHTDAGYLDARMVGGVARLVVQSTPRLSLPQPAGNPTDRQRVAANRAAVAGAPLSDWLPTYEVLHDGLTTTHSVPCERVSHPVHYTGAAMLTVYTVDLAKDLSDPQPISLAADGSAVYASTTSLYVASVDGTRTQLHRFDIAGTGQPRYLGSGSVPGYLLNSYSMSDYAGALRVVTSAAYGTAETSLYVLDAGSLHIVGRVAGLGRGEQLHAVRFLGPLAYVVTFESVDPLYVIDLHDPAHPRRAGALTITGYSDYLHPISPGRLLGVGESVNSAQVVTGLQVSLFDVHSPAHPARLARVVRNNTPSETPIDPHAFLYWPVTGTAVVPVDSWNAGESGAALVLHVGTDALSVIGTIRNPAVSSTSGYDTGIERTLVVGQQIWTMSSAGLQVSDLRSLARDGWVPFQ
jgi:hypothetical protein